jgi:hypothetical protein
VFGKLFGRKLSCVVVVLFALAGSSLSVAQTEQQIKAVVDRFSQLSRALYPELLKQIQKTGQYRYSIVMRDGTTTQGVVTALGSQGILVEAVVPLSSRGQNGQMEDFTAVVSMIDNNGDGVLDQISAPGGRTVYSPRDLGSLMIWAAQLDGIYKQLGN